MAVADAAAMLDADVEEDLERVLQSEEEAAVAASYAGSMAALGPNEAVRRLHGDAWKGPGDHKLSEMAPQVGCGGEGEM